MLIYLTIEAGESIESKKARKCARARAGRTFYYAVFIYDSKHKIITSVRQPCSLPLAAQKGISGNFMSPARRAEYSALLDYAHGYPTASGVFDAA